MLGKVLCAAINLLVIGVSGSRLFRGFISMLTAFGLWGCVVLWGFGGSGSYFYRL